MPVLVSSQKTRINGAYLYNNVYAFSTATASYTGTLKIKLPTVAQNTMMMIRILVFNYVTNKSFEVIVSGYAYNKASWINHSAYCSNKNQISRIALGYEGTNPVILLGTTTTKWDYPQVGVTDLLAGYSGQSGWGEDYSLAFITSETGLSGIVTPAINSGLDADTLDGNHASAFALVSHGNHVPAVQAANNKVFLRNDNTWQTVTPANIGAEPAFTKNTAFNKAFGTAAGTICQGNDSRLSDARTPKAHTHPKSQITDFPMSLPAAGGTADYTKYINANNIAANTDLNSLTTPGFYYCPANVTVATLTNSPTTNAFFLIVGKHAGVYQEVVEYMTASPKRYMRNYYSGTWGAWYRVFTTSNPPTPGETGALAATGTAENAKKVNGLTVLTAVPSGAKFTDTIYTHPAYTARAAGLYKITVDAKGHVSAVAAVVKADLTSLGIPGQDTVYAHPTTSGNKHIPAGGASGQILRWSSAGTAVWGADNNTTYAVFTAAANGLVPASGGGTAKFLRADGTWQVPPSGSGGNTVTVNTTAPSSPKKGDIWI